MYAYLSEAAVSSSIGSSLNNSHGDDNRPSTNTISGTLFGSAGSLYITEKFREDKGDEREPTAIRAKKLRTARILAKARRRGKACSASAVGVPLGMFGCQLLH